MSKWLALVLVMAGALSGPARAQGTTRYDGRYMAELTLVGVRTGDCTQPPFGALYPLSIARGEVSFAYLPRFSTTLTGRIAENGTFNASARLPKGRVQMTGRVSGNSVAASIISPSCRYTLQSRN